MGLLDLLFPPRCAGCRRYGVAWCAACDRAVEPIVPASLAGSALIAGGRFDGALQRAVHCYKYGGRQGLARDLSRVLITAMEATEIRFQAVAYVPLHPQRRKERGFNQAERLAAEVARRTGLPLLDGLTRVRATPAQVGLSQPERQANLLGAFAWTGPRPAPQGLALVDDVCTTGATLEAAAAAVRRAGGSIAAFLVLARAQTLSPVPVVTLPGQPACP